DCSGMSRGSGGSVPLVMNQPYRTGRTSNGCNSQSVLMGCTRFDSLRRAAAAALGGTTGEHADVGGKGLRRDFQALGHGQIGTPLGGQLGHGHISCQDIAPAAAKSPASVVTAVIPTIWLVSASATILINPRVSRLT